MAARAAAGSTPSFAATATAASGAEMSTSSRKYAVYKALATRFASAGSFAWSQRTIRAAACVEIGNFDGIRKRIPWKRALLSKSRFE